MNTFFGIAIGIVPFLAVIGLFALLESRRHRREDGLVRQIELTEAIHQELGAAAAPTVTRGLGGSWTVTMKAPLDRPGTVAALVRITHRVFEQSTSRRNGEGLAIVLESREVRRPATLGTVHPAGRHPMRPAAAA